MAERGAFVDLAAVHRWAIKILPVLAVLLRKCKRPLGTSWPMHETCIDVAGQWKYLYSAVDRDGSMIDFLLRAKRNCAAARRFLEHVIDLHPRRSPSTRAAPTRPPSRMSKPTAARKSKCA